MPAISAPLRMPLVPLPASPWAYTDAAAVSYSPMTDRRPYSTFELVVRELVVELVLVRCLGTGGLGLESDKPLPPDPIRGMGARGQGGVSRQDPRTCRASDCHMVPQWAAAAPYTERSVY